MNFLGISIGNEPKEPKGMFVMRPWTSTFLWNAPPFLTTPLLTPPTLTGNAFPQTRRKSWPEWHFSSWKSAAPNEEEVHGKADHFSFPCLRKLVA